MRADNYITAVNPLNSADPGPRRRPRALRQPGDQRVLRQLQQGRSVIPPAGDARHWDAVRRLSLADQSFEINVQLILDKTPAGQATFDWGWPKLMAAFDQMERDAATYAGFDVGHASNLQTLSYFDRCCRAGPRGVRHRRDLRLDRDPPDAGWPRGSPSAIERPSVQGHFGKDFTGDVERRAALQAGSVARPWPFAVGERGADRTLLLADPERPKGLDHAGRGRPPPTW